MHSSLSLDKIPTFHQNPAPPADQTMSPGSVTISGFYFHHGITQPVLFRVSLILPRPFGTGLCFEFYFPLCCEATGLSCPLLSPQLPEPQPHQHVWCPPYIHTTDSPRKEFQITHFKTCIQKVWAQMFFLFLRGISHKSKGFREQT